MATLGLQIADELTDELSSASASGMIPEQALLLAWVEATLAQTKRNADHEISIRIVDKVESQSLNRQYRGKDKATNVLSFPCDLPPGVDIPLLGDLAICAPIVSEEACAQGKTEESHWAHMVVHGTLHLLGFDHEIDSDAETMEATETAILHTLGYPSPY